MHNPGAGQSFVRAVARLVHARYALGTPSDVEALAKAVGIGLYREMEPADQRFTGALWPDTPVGPIMAINGRNPRSRQRFTIAHELGHWFLHRRVSRFFDVDSGGDGSAPKPEQFKREREANVFAAEVLMPGPLLQKAVVRRLSPTDIARMFDVSIEAMLRHLTDYGLLQ